MINVSDWKHRKERYEQYWNLENKTPILYITSPKENANYDKSLYNVPSDTYWFDPSWKIKAIRDDFNNTYFGGDSFPYVSPSLGPDIMSGFLGLKIIYNEASSWVEHKDCHLSELANLKFDKENNFYFNKMTEMLKAFTEDAKNGDYIVGMVDLNPGADGIASLIGADKLCFEMMDNPDDVDMMSRKILDLYKYVYTYFDNIVTKYQGGNTNWLGVYSDIPWYFISCDFMCMVSPKSFDRFLDWEIRERVKFHKRSMFHLDGENAVVHLDKILKIDDLTAVEVQATPYVHCAKIWVEYIKKIQDAKKCVWIEAKNEEDIKVLMENCKPEGLFIKTWADSEEKAKKIEDMVNDFYK
ncbi:MAG: hypothetical protein QME45_10970 [Clostridiales bacterium]|nr:hypothetical protein [Clostridiales bacterium]